MALADPSLHQMRRNAGASSLKNFGTVSFSIREWFGAAADLVSKYVVDDNCYSM